MAFTCMLSIKSLSFVFFFSLAALWRYANLQVMVTSINTVVWNVWSCGFCFTVECLVLPFLYSSCFSLLTILDIWDHKFPCMFEMSVYPFFFGIIYTLVDFISVPMGVVGELCIFYSHDKLLCWTQKELSFVCVWERERSWKCEYSFLLLM